MKKFFAVLIALVVAVGANVCSAYLDPVSVTDLKDTIGNWYDTKGNLVLTVSRDYKINGCTVLSVNAGYDTAALYNITIDEGNRHRTLELLHTGSYDSRDHEILVMNYKSNNEYALRRTKNPRYFESIGGIYLGMDKDEVIKRYGQPSSIDQYHSTWKYNNLGLDVRFEWNVVTGITIYPYGDRRFDWSGLSAKSSRADFEYKYNTKMSQRGNLKIGHGEVIRMNKIIFGNNGVCLEILTAGYVF